MKFSVRTDISKTNVTFVSNVNCEWACSLDPRVVVALSVSEALQLIRNCL